MAYEWLIQNPPAGGEFAYRRIWAQDDLYNWLSLSVTGLRKLGVYV